MFASIRQAARTTALPMRRLLHSTAPVSAVLFKTPLKDISFILNDVLGAEKHYKQFGKEEVNRELITNIAEECASFSETVLAPLNATGDAEGCKYNPKDASVTTPKGFKEAYAEYAKGGWQAMCVPPEFGGQGE